MRHRTALLVAAALIFAGPAVAAEGYDNTWYETNFWNGEYPNGFTVTAPTTIKIRQVLSLDAARSVDCTLTPGATYHPWNAKRIESDKLTFKSFSKIEDMTVKSAMDVTLFTHDDGTETPQHFAKGDKWRYLTYLAEGAFLLDVGGKLYEGDQDLLENSTSKTPEAHANDQWLQLTCANGATGWLLYSDLADVAGIGEPNIVTYGEAADAGG